MRPPAPGVSSRCNSRGASRTASSIFTHVALLAGRDVRSAPPAKKLRRHLLLVQFSSVRVRFLELIEQQWPLASSGASSAWILRPRRAHVTRASRAWRWRGGWRLAIRRVAGHRRQPRTARAQRPSRGPGVRRNAGACPFQLPPRADDTAACTWLHRIGTYGTLASGPTVRLGCTMAY